MYSSAIQSKCYHMDRTLFMLRDKMQILSKGPRTRGAVAKAQLARSAIRTELFDNIRIGTEILSLRNQLAPSIPNADLIQIDNEILNAMENLRAPEFHYMFVPKTDDELKVMKAWKDEITHTKF